MSQDKSRAAFEAWMSTQLRGYAFGHADWDVWQASRAQALEEAARVCEDGWHLLTRHECAEAIRELAAKTKGE